MAQEIERKFLVSGEFKSLATSHSRIVQGYISSARGRTVRVRIRDDKGYLTIKGASNASGTSRYEWEKELPLAEAEELMKLCEPGIIDSDMTSTSPRSGIGALSLRRPRRISTACVSEATAASKSRRL